MAINRCPTCDRPRAGDVAVSHSDGCTCPGCLSVCWRDWGVLCEPADWRARAIADAARWRKVAPLIEAMREAAKVAHHDYATEDDATVDFRVTGHELIDAVTNLLAATKEP